MLATVVFISGQRDRAAIVLAPGETWLGRGERCDIEVLDPLVSRRHCRFLARNDIVLIQDQGSSHGTFVNDVPVGERALAHGDRITVGRTHLLFLDGARAERTELPGGLAHVATAQLDTAPAGNGPEVAGNSIQTPPRARWSSLGIVGESPALLELAAQVERVAPSDATVLITGETGSGKEAVAQALHRLGARGERTFAAVNCATLQGQMLESELFGHERGAFTGAIRSHAGWFERAQGGTLFLDEVGELAPEAQARLLRALQERVIERVGGERSIPVNVRVIAATNRDLEEAAREGTFRKDLFFRLAVIELHVPALRQRTVDIPLLCRHFMRRACQDLKRPPLQFEPAVMDALLRYSWPGNVRELANTMERLAILVGSDKVGMRDLPHRIGERAASDKGGFQVEVEAFKRNLVARELQRQAGHVVNTARSLGLSPNYLHRLMKSLGLR